ncbi:Probable arabinose 5-phosphate isomerase [Linum perenne]
MPLPQVSTPAMAPQLRRIWILLPCINLKSLILLLVVLFSKSGNTEELLRFVLCARAKGAHLVVVTFVEGNMLASVCDSNVHLPIERELCPFNLAPITSTAI